MPRTPPEGCQRVVPYLAYEDAPAAIQFLCKAFGFTERFRLDMKDGRIGHAELSLKDNVLFLASAFPEMGMASPRSLPSIHSLVMCYVDDVDTHHEQARGAGATIMAEPKDQFYGERSYRAVDPEGHRWMFATVVREVSEEEVRANMKEA